MEIKKLVFDLEKNKWLLLLEPGNLALELSEDTIVFFELVQGKQLSVETYNEVLKYDELQKHYQAAINFLSRRRTSFEVLTFLTEKKEVSLEAAKEVVEKLESQQYLNDFEYAKAFIHDQIHFQRKSFFVAKTALKNKGITNRNILEEILYWYESNEQLIQVEIDNLKILIKQLEKSNIRYNDFERNQRIIAKLTQKGYNKDTIKQLLPLNSEVTLSETEKRKLLEKNRRRVFQAKNSYQYIAYMQKYNIDKEELLAFFNNERMNQND